MTHVADRAPTTALLVAVIYTVLLASCTGPSRPDAAEASDSERAAQVVENTVLVVSGVLVEIGSHQIGEYVEGASADGLLSVGPGGCLIVVENEPEGGLVPVFPQGTRADEVDGAVLVSFPKGGEVTVGTQVSLTGAVALWEAGDALLKECDGAGAGAFVVNSP